MNEEEKYNQILHKKEMSKEEAEEIIDEMYHDKIKVYGEGNVVHLDLIGTVKFTNLEFASVTLLREVVCLENEIRDLYKMMSAKVDEIDYLADKIEQMKEDYISKDKIKELKEFVHETLDDNGITRGYQLTIDNYFKELLGE